MIGFRVNFIKDTMEIFYNGYRLGVLWKNIPKCFAIIMCTPDNKQNEKDDVQITQRVDNFINAPVTFYYPIFE